MLHSRHELGLYVVETWEEASGKARTSQDSLLLAEREHGLRVAAIDGATPAPATPRRVGVDGACWAAGVTRTALTAFTPAEEAIAAANSELFDSSLSRRNRQQAAVVVADIDADGVTLVRGGDCEAWVLRDSEWSPLFVSGMLTDDCYRQLHEWEQQHRDASLNEAIAVEDLLTGDPSVWITAPVGGFEQTMLETVTIGNDWDALALMSDGARMNAERIVRLREWIDELRRWETEELQLAYAGQKRYDDVTVALVSRR